MGRLTDSKICVSIYNGYNWYSMEIQVRVPNGNFKKSFSRRKHTSLRSEFTGFAISDGLRPERLLSQPMLLGDMEMRKTFVH